MSAPVYPTPVDPRVAMLVATLDPSQREHFEERAAIVEFESKGVTRAEAEVEALLEVLSTTSRRPAVRLYRLRQGRECQWVLTTDLTLARTRLGGPSAPFEEAVLGGVLQEAFQGVAVLAAAP